VIRELDWSVGEVAGMLAELDLLDRTILIFMSDNGPYYGGSTGGLKGMKATTWEGGIRVPFIIRYPEKLGRGIEVQVPCWSPDILPTILSLSGLDPVIDRVLDGEDITPVLNGESREHAPVFSLHNDQIKSVRKGEFKLFLEKPRYQRKAMDAIDPRRPDGTTILAPFEQATWDQYPGIVPEEPLKEIQLFHLTADLTESRELSDSLPEKVNELLHEFEVFTRSLQTAPQKNQ
jgi:uncharacterized sulfatase